MLLVMYCAAQVVPFRGLSFVFVPIVSVNFQPSCTVGFLSLQIPSKIMENVKVLGEVTYFHY